MIFGHQDLVKDFKQLVKNNRLAHGYVFFGEPQIGKFFFAKHLANLLENGEFSAGELSGRPLQDLMVIDSTEDLKTDAIGIESSRSIKDFIYKKPAVSSKRTLIIDGAEKITLEAQNAILKITEEPPENALLILILNNPEVLLPTILSRLQKIYFGRLSDGEMGKVTSDIKIVELAFGRPGRAIRLAKADENTKTAEHYALQFAHSQGPARSNLIKEFIDEQKEKPEVLDMFFESLILNLQKDTIKNNEILRDVLHRLFLIKSYNVNKRLQLEAVFESVLQIRTSE